MLTHAHLDHCGYLPRLVAAGFRGRVFCTPGTRDLCTLVLPDSAHIQEEDARQANRRGYSKHSPALPLYTANDAARALDLLQPVGYDRPVPVVPGVEVDFINAGHLLGSAYARVRIGEQDDSLRRRSRPLRAARCCRIRRRSKPPTSCCSNRRTAIACTSPTTMARGWRTIVNETVARGGKLMIPSFAIGRVEEVLYWLKRLEDSQRIPVLPGLRRQPDGRRRAAVLSIAAELDTELGCKAPLIGRAIDRRACRLRLLHRADDHRRVGAAVQGAGRPRATPAIVIAASGMATGGRVLHHLAAVLPDPRNTVLFVGYQAAGTRGRLLSTARKRVKMHGQDVPVAARIERIDSMSAHADRGEIMRWLSGFTRPPSMTYLVHGEPAALEALGQPIAAERGWPVHIARYLERVELNLR